MLKVITLHKVRKCESWTIYESYEQIILKNVNFIPTEKKQPQIPH